MNRACLFLKDTPLPRALKVEVLDDIQRKIWKLQILTEVKGKHQHTINVSSPTKDDFET